MRILLRIAINAVALFVTAYLLPGIDLTGGIWGLLIVAVIFGLVNAFIRPIVKLFSLPITCLTLGLFTLVINTGMLLLTAWLAGSFLSFTGSVFENLLTAFIAAIIISLISAVLGWFVPDKD
jgi:putative membrane protein